MWTRIGEELCVEALLHQPELVAQLPDLLLNTAQVAELEAPGTPHAAVEACRLSGEAAPGSMRRKQKRNISEVLDLLDDSTTRAVRRREQAIDEVLRLLESPADAV